LATETKPYAASRVGHRTGGKIVNEIIKISRLLDSWDRMQGPPVIKVRTPPRGGLSGGRAGAGLVAPQSRSDR
jgi:hypothetical protein